MILYQLLLNCSLSHFGLVLLRLYLLLPASSAAIPLVVSFPLFLSTSLLRPPSLPRSPLPIAHSQYRQQPTVELCHANCGSGSQYTGQLIIHLPYLLDSKFYGHVFAVRLSHSFSIFLRLTHEADFSNLIAIFGSF